MKESHLFSLFDDVGHVLYNQPELREGLNKIHGNMTGATADVTDDCAIGETTPRIN